eukprot:TRINITY_DN27249_c0_g1_i1.p1 TRINITY_DN27249_c0_g1~~TRINITY_DN27249_c0_g1_i1.p1  ORF type:complete len:372 (+),score=96.11 TRINITY_DN27249_c0_g1_i1:46-1161(+)
MIVFFFFFKQKTAYEMLRSLVGSEMCIRDSINAEYGVIQSPSMAMRLATQVIPRCYPSSGRSLSSLALQPTGLFDNSAREYQHITVLPHAAAMGAEICGVDLSKQLSPAVFAEIKDALHRHHMVYFTGQERMGHGDQQAFTEMFGEFGDDAYTQGLPDFPHVQPVVKEATTKTPIIFGEGWHTDSPFLAAPPSIAVLRGVAIPPFGGDTLWSNTTLAYEHLSEVYQQMLAPLRVHMSAEAVVACLEASSNPDGRGKVRASDVEMKDLDTKSMTDGSFHPLVRTHPVTGKKALYLGRTYACGIQGMSQEESKPLLEFLERHATRVSFQCRLRWTAGTVCVWDNRSCLHHAFNDHDGFRREMYRTTVKGEVPT